MKTEQILSIARRYYEDNLPQDEIAREFSVSASTVSRAIKLARERGWVRTIVVAPSGNMAQLECRLRDRFDLEYLAVVPAAPTPQDTLEAVARAGAAYLSQIVPDHDVVAVAGGRTLTAVARQLRPAHRPELTVVSAVGGWVGQSAISASEVAREMAMRWDAQVAALFAPAFVSEAGLRQALLREESIRVTLEKACSATLACIGLAPVAVEPTNLQARYASSTGMLSEADMRCLLALGAVGETLAQFFDIEGNLIDSWNRERTIGLPLDDFKGISSVLAVAAGIEKAPAVLGACRGGLVNALIISDDLAHEVEHLDKITG